MAQSDSSVVVVDDRRILDSELMDVALRSFRTQLSDQPSWAEKIRNSRRVLEQALTAGAPVYGVTTGIGFSSSKNIGEDDIEAFASNIFQQHGCGVGTPLTKAESRAVVFARLVSLSKGFSAIRVELLEALTELLNHDVVPVIPRFGSVGASGDLTPLSYVVAVLMGEREAFFKDRVMPAADALQQAGLEPLTMVPKEQLAMMNGTSVMTAVGLIAVERLDRTLDMCERVSALATELLYGRSDAFHPTAHKVKPFPGQVAAASTMREAVKDSRMMDRVKNSGRIIQDPYSIRCAPHVIGAARDALTWAKNMLVVELNSVNDNPIVDPEREEILFAGNFYGGHVALAMDLMKIAAASVADMLDRQFALMVDSRFNMGLPETLVAYDGNGVKALQLTTTALTAVAAQRTASDTICSRPTEVNNQDKVSMGLNAALTASDIVTLLQQVLATEMIALSNAATLRDESMFSSAGRELLSVLRKRSPVLEVDRRLDHDIEALVELIDDVAGQQRLYSS